MAVVVGYLPTKEGRAALRRAAEEAVLRKSRMVVVNSVRPGRSPEASAGDQLDAELAEIQARLDQAGVAYEVRHVQRNGEPSEDLISVAEEEDAGFIVIGLRRRTPVGKLILGSNAQRILLDAPCPVLAVKAERD
ncbi:MAG TPA: universal stress protein [Dermatophilaceae bacterium]|nr:universal stress protein [Dermatophilaceae bacterium]